VGTYSQWRTAVDKGDLRRVVWICGDQHVLVEEVIDTIREHVNAGELDYTSLSCVDTADRDIWAAAMQYPLTPGASRLLLVRDAEKLGNWEPLTEWMDHSRQLPGSHLVFVSNETNVPDKPYIEALQSRRRIGQVVRCSQPSPEDAIAWVRRRSRLDQEMAFHLLRRVGGNIAVAASVCTKLTAFDGTAGPATIDALCDQEPGQSFVDALIAGDKPEALLAVPRMTDREQGAAITLLSARLDILGALWRSSRHAQSVRDLRGVPVFLAKKYRHLARDYDPNRCVYARRVVAVVDEAYRSGARVGVLEALVALW